MTTTSDGILPLKSKEGVNIFYIDNNKIVLCKLLTIDDKNVLLRVGQEELLLPKEEAAKKVCFKVAEAITAYGKVTEDYIKSVAASYEPFGFAGHTMNEDEFHSFIEWGITTGHFAPAYSTGIIPPVGVNGTQGDSLERLLGEYNKEKV